MVRAVSLTLKHCASLGMAALIFFLSTATGFSPSPTASETEVKAAFLYNFAKFVEWPANAFTTDTAPIQVVVFGDEDFGAKLKVLMVGQKAHGRTFDVKNISNPQDAKTSHIVFVSGAENRKTAQVLEATKKSPVLTVGESEAFLDAGGMITLVPEDAQLRFEVNPEAAQKVKLEISSQMLRLAKKRSSK
jgi:hypothetical protein